MGGAYMYQTIQLPSGPPTPAGTSSRGDAVGAGVKLLQKTVLALQDMALAYRTNKALNSMSDEIDVAIAEYKTRFPGSKGETGALIVVGIQEWAMPDPTGARAQMFLSIHIGGAGGDPATVVDEYLRTPRMVAGPADGWRRKNLFVWATRRID